LSYFTIFQSFKYPPPHFVCTYPHLLFFSHNEWPSEIIAKLVVMS
jgi:hypothetical protein